MITIIESMLGWRQNPLDGGLKSTSRDGMDKQQGKPRVVHVNKAPYDVYIGRMSKFGDPKFGNPFMIPRDGTREEVIAKFKAWVVTQPHLMAALPELRGKTLGCHCSPLPCHGDVLWEMANRD